MSKDTPPPQNNIPPHPHPQAPKRQLLFWLILLLTAVAADDVTLGTYNLDEAPLESSGNC